MRKMPWVAEEQVMGFKYKGQGEFVHLKLPWHIILIREGGIKGLRAYFQRDAEPPRLIGGYANFAAMWLNTRWDYDPTDAGVCAQALDDFANVCLPSQMQQIRDMPFEVWQTTLLIMYDLFMNEKKS